MFIAASREGTALHHRDVLLEIAGQAVNAPTDIAAIVARLRPGFQAPVRIWRNGTLQDTSLHIPDAVGVDSGKPAAATNTATATSTSTSAPTPATDKPGAVAETGWYCTGSVNRSKPVLLVRAPVNKQAGASYSAEAATATLRTLLARGQAANPGNWHDLSKATCYENGAVFAGEKFCYAGAFKRLGGGSQGAALFCNASREMIDKRWQDMAKQDGGNAQLIDWP